MAQSLAEREGISPAARAFAEEGERLALSCLDVEPGRERAAAAALGARGSALLAASVQAALALVERAAASGLGSLRVLVGREPAELVASLPVVPKEELLSSKVPAVTLEGYGYDPQRGELWFAGETAEAVLIELEARRRALEEETVSLEAQAADAAEVAENAAMRAGQAEAAFAEVAHLVAPGYRRSAVARAARGARGAAPELARRG